MILPRYIATKGFLADRTNGCDYARVLCPSVCRLLLTP